MLFRTLTLLFTLSLCVLSQGEDKPKEDEKKKDEPVEPEFEFLNLTDLKE